MMNWYYATDLSSQAVGSCTLPSPQPTGGDYDCTIADNMGANLVLIQRKDSIRLQNIAVYAGYDCHKYTWQVYDNSQTLANGKKFDYPSDGHVELRFQIDPKEVTSETTTFWKNILAACVEELAVTFTIGG